MSYHAGKNQVAANAPYRTGVLRIWHNDERQCYSVTEPGDPHYGTAVLNWDADGEFWDGTRWRPMTERGAWLDGGGVPGVRTA